jgi:5-methylcytosine-specific restriction endonuclease McrA
MFEEQQGKCWICGALMLLDVSVNDPMFATFDHVKAISLGGKWEDSNLKLAHKICNARRGNGAKRFQRAVDRWLGNPEAQPFTAAWLRAKGYM